MRKLRYVMSNKVVIFNTVTFICRKCTKMTLEQPKSDNKKTTLKTFHKTLSILLHLIQKYQKRKPKYQKKTLKNSFLKLTKK